MLNKRIILFIIVFIIAFLCNTFVNRYVVDEIWSYGFSYNISRGLVIYKDFNVLQMPLYFFLGSIFIKIFGSYMFSMNIMDAFLIAFLISLLFKKMKFKVLCLLPLFLMLQSPSYNFFALFWLILVLYFLDNKDICDEIFGLLVGLLFITKQNLGIVAFIPMIYYSRNKIKSVVCFVLPFLILSIYFLYHHAFYRFIDCCFLGLFDFGHHNTEYDLFIVILEICLCLFYLILLIKSHFQNKNIFYILSFQLITYPICDFNHFVYCILLFVYVLLMFYSSRRNIMLLVFLSYYFWFSLFINQFPIVTSKDNNFLLFKNRNFSYDRSYYVYDDKINYYIENSDYQFYFFDCNYYFKLLYDIPINNYDLMLYGNMGYHGEVRIIRGIDNICRDNNCIFFVARKNNFLSQYSDEILTYVKDSYSLVDNDFEISIYASDESIKNRG